MEQQISKLSRSGLIITLTGGIAAGKSFILRHFRKMGYNTLSVDRLAHQCLASDVMKAILQEQFEDCFDKNGALDKKLLSAVVFRDLTRLKKLNNAIHPLIRAQYEVMIESHIKHQNRSMVIEIPLMVEAMINDDYVYKAHIRFLVTSEYDTRLKRALLRNGMTREKFNAITKLQLPDSIKSQHVDFIIHNENRLSTLNQVGRFFCGKFKRDSIRY